MPTVIKLQTEAGNFIKKETWQTCFPVNFEKFLGILFIQNTTRSSRPEVFCKKGGLKNFAKFTRKHLCHSPFFNKVAGLRPTTLLKKRLWHRFFLVNFVELLRTHISTEHLWWLLLHHWATAPVHFCNPSTRKGMNSCKWFFDPFYGFCLLFVQEEMCNMTLVRLKYCHSNKCEKTVCLANLI